MSFKHVFHRVLVVQNFCSFPRYSKDQLLNFYVFIFTHTIVTYAGWSENKNAQ